LTPHVGPRSPYFLFPLDDLLFDFPLEDLLDDFPPDDFEDDFLPLEDGGE
jgi:hypothetical protein